jgi:hypothetical protein
LSDEGTSRGLQKVERFLIHYWLQNPRARDTLEGIYTWWLPHELRDLSHERMLEVVDELRERGWILEWRSKTGVITYGINPERRQELEDYLTFGF